MCANLKVSSATVALAAEALAVEPARIAKTLSFYGDERHPCILVVAAGDAKVDNGKFKKQFGHKARMIAAQEVEALTGHAPGGVCPFANPEGVYTVLDISLKRFDTVFPRVAAEIPPSRWTCRRCMPAPAHRAGWTCARRGNRRHSQNRVRTVAALDSMVRSQQLSDQKLATRSALPPPSAGIASHEKAKRLEILTIKKFATHVTQRVGHAVSHHNGMRGAVNWKNEGSASIWKGCLF